MSRKYPQDLKDRAVRLVLDTEIARVHADDYGVYGAVKVWRELNRQGQKVARCTVERLMTETGLRGAVRGTQVRTTGADPAAERAGDLVERGFVATAPNRTRVADFTHVPTDAGVVYVAFVVDTYSRAAARSKQAVLVLSALETGLWRRDRRGHPVRPGEPVHHSDAGSQYSSFLFTSHLASERIAASIGSVGDAYDNALMESAIGLCKTELITPRRPWKTLGEVEPATAEWADRYNTTRLHGEIDHVPPEEYETAYYAKTPKNHTSQQRTRASNEPGEVHVLQPSMLHRQPGVLQPSELQRRRGGVSPHEVHRRPNISQPGEVFR
ncbi:putative transposase [Spinactinospora alkalitolerans]|uniref:Putative transposase n=1 Tax=Spinactinospora alkalitolerans TaxID=687207 RepID=A0A852U011_9ACTN|nr:IS3 family transposase [Spinactinospora alkalitolerans]NYE49518.1 putative transposase [Spinactinospora alkalitolerans]